MSNPKVLSTASHPGEGGHWYQSNGDQVTSVTGAKGQPVKPDVRHARKLNLGPGVTTIIKSASAPGLERWKRNQAVAAALTLERESGEDEKSYLRRIEVLAEERSIAARDEGTQIHAAIQSKIDGDPVDERWFSHVEVAMVALRGVGIEDYKAEVSCAHPLGYGTKADLVGHRSGWLIDFKTKDELGESPTVYDEHLMQLAATREALLWAGYQIDRAGICFISRAETPKAVIVEAKLDDVRGRGWSMFVALNSYWKVKNRHSPSWPTTHFDMEDES